MNGDMQQLGFDGLLQEAETENNARAFDRQTAHLPEDWEDALAFHRDQIDRHHAAMLACDFKTALTIREEAHLLARKLNGGAPGILADRNAPGCRLARAAKALDGSVPLWGQDGTFTLKAAGCAVRVEMKGLFGICATSSNYLGFSVRAVERDAPFFSETGYRSFLGASVAPEENMTTDAFVCRVLNVFLAEDLRGQLKPIRPM